MGEGEKFSILKDLSNQAVLEFEEIHAKCKDLYLKLSQEHDKKQKLEAQFKQLKRVSLLAVSEYENLLKQYTDQTKVKEDVEAKLKKAQEENKELRKASNISQNVSILPANSSKGTGNGATKGELEGLKSLLNGMKDEIRRAKNEKSKTEKQLEDEKGDHEVTKTNLKVINAQFQQLSRVSDMALEESKELRKKYEAEVACRKKAEEYATQVLRDNESMVRKSKVIKEDSAPDEKLVQALKEIDELNSSLAKERSDCTEKIKDIQEELESLRDAQTIKALEDKLSVSCDQIEILQLQVQESVERAQQSERRARDLSDKLIRTEEALLSSGQGPQSQILIASPTPPPPPPPPPPMPAPALKKFITRIGISKKKTTKDKGKEDPIQDMMKEMMARIQKGTHLKSSKPKDDGSAPAMNELASLLTNLKHGQANQKETEVAVPSAVPEFQKFKLKKVSVDKGHAKSEEQQVDTELMKKLGKQKRVAEGGDNKIEEGPSNDEENSHYAEVSEKEISELEKSKRNVQEDFNTNDKPDISKPVQFSEKSSGGQDHEEKASLDSKDGTSRKEDEMSGTECRENKNQAANEETNIHEERCKGPSDGIPCDVKDASRHETKGDEATSRDVESMVTDRNNAPSGSGNRDDDKDNAISFDGIIDEINELLE